MKLNLDEITTSYGDEDAYVNFCDMNGLDGDASDTYALFVLTDEMNDVRQRVATRNHCRLPLDELMEI